MWRDDGVVGRVCDGDRVCVCVDIVYGEEGVCVVRGCVVVKACGGGDGVSGDDKW